MNEIEIEHRITEIEQRGKSNTHRIDKLEPIVQEIHTMSKTMVQLVGEVRHTNETVDALGEKVDMMDSRVDKMEKEPADSAKRNKETAMTTVISTIAGALTTAAIGAIIYFM